MRRYSLLAIILTFTLLGITLYAIAQDSQRFYLPVVNRPVPTPTSTPPIGIWLSQEEIAALPMSGSAWENVVSTADSLSGQAQLDDNDSKHDVQTLAAALYTARTGEKRERVVDALRTVPASEISRVLELSRGLQSYIIAADLIGYDDPEFRNFVDTIIRDESIDGNGSDGVLGTAAYSPNNWGGHARATAAAAAVYLGDQALLEDVTRWHMAFLGEDNGHQMRFKDTNWHADPDNKRGINAKGARIEGKNVDGVLPEELRRGGEFTWPPNETGYVWEGMQGLVVTHIILWRAGQIDLDAEDNAIVRAMDWLYKVVEWPAEGDDTWIPWLINGVFGTDYPTTPAKSGKGMGFTDWTHGS